MAPNLGMIYLKEYVAIVIPSNLALWNNKICCLLTNVSIEILNNLSQMIEFDLKFVLRNKIDEQLKVE